MSPPLRLLSRMQKGTGGGGGRRRTKMTTIRKGNGDGNHGAESSSSPSQPNPSSPRGVKVTSTSSTERKRQILPSMIKNKQRRSELHAKLKRQKRTEKRKKLKARSVAEKKALELGEELPPRKEPKTIENTREVDETICKGDDEELFAQFESDEFSSILNRQRTPKVLITTSRFNSTRGPAFISELLGLIPNAHYYKRGTYDLKKIVKYAKEKDFTSIIVVHSNQREPDALLIIVLPNGPTAHFKLSNLILRKDIKNHGKPTTHPPELVLNNFVTQLGSRIGRLIQSLFLQNPDFRGRRVVTFHNQRDFIFFRHHRYIFEPKENRLSDDTKSKGKKAPVDFKARLQECGPRFTLKLRSLQHGTFDTKGGEYEWVKKPEMETSRRRFFL
ncbi:hypothetical protein Dimus_025266 [Dionaea muscipula]